MAALAKSHKAVIKISLNFEIPSILSTTHLLKMSGHFHPKHRDNFSSSFYEICERKQHCYSFLMNMIQAKNYLRSYLEEMVWRAEMTERGISTARKTAMTTISIIVVELASLCLRSRLSFVKPKIDILLKQEI